MVIRTATAVAREGGVGTAVEQTTFCTLDLRSSSAVTQIFGLYCMPGVAARRLQALGATRGWGVAETGGAPGMVGRFGWQRGAGAGGGRAPGARGGGGGGGGGRRSLRLGSAGLGRARLGSAAPLFAPVPCVLAPGSDCFVAFGLGPCPCYAPWTVAAHPCLDSGSASSGPESGSVSFLSPCLVLGFFLCAPARGPGPGLCVEAGRGPASHHIGKCHLGPNA